VQVYDVGEADGLPYFAMEYVEGGSLAQELAGTPQPAPQAAALVATIAGAVQAAHQGGVVHRDLKPANVLLTADGAPKVSDFGLARRLDDESGLSRTGIALGTPSYMAPEQAAGKTAEVGPATDVYALGAVLYELLTGRPPFRAETAAETLRQVLSQEPAPPSRLNDKAPRDLETICLKCLNKEPSRRYPSAVALADDLRRFLDGQPIVARPVSSMERAGRWIKRNPRETALAGFAVLLILAAGAGAWWSDRQTVARRAEQKQQEERTRRGVVGALDQARSMGALARWPQAQEALEQADLLVGNEGPEDLRQRVAVARRDLRMAEELDRIRQLKETILEISLDKDLTMPAHVKASRDHANKAQAPLAFVKAFRDHGLAILEDDLADLAQSIRDSQVQQQLLAALDHWAVLEPDAAIQERLTAIARAVDPNPWRDRVRNPAVWKNWPALGELAGAASLTDQPIHLLIALGMALPVDGVHQMSPPVFAASLVAGAASPAGVSSLLAVFALVPVAMDGVEFLRRAQQEQPADFWANLALGNSLLNHRPDEAIAFYRAALAVRPESVAVCNNLALALRTTGRSRQAIALLERALRSAPRDPLLHNTLGTALQDVAQPVAAAEHFRQALAEMPDTAAIHYNLGSALQERGLIDDAIEQYRQAIRLDANDPWFHSKFAHAQLMKGRLDEAVDHFRQASRLLPRSAQIRVAFGVALQRKGRLDEAIDQYRLALRLDPQEPTAHYNLGDVLLDLGRTEEALACLRRAIQLDPRYAEPHYCLGNFFKANGRLNEAIDSFKQAVAIDPNFASAHYNLGNALKDMGRYDEAVAHYQQTVRIDPTHANCQGALGQALVALGRFGEAQAASLRCLELLPQGDARRPLAQRQLQQCEELLVLERRLPDILHGKEKPADATEGFQFGEICRIKKMPVAAARLFAGALQAAPALFADPRTGHRYNAACAAALAGCTNSEAEIAISEDERARWRKEARAWLRADLVAWSQMSDRDPAIRALMQRTLTHWQADPDLAGLRDPQALDKMSPSEQEECRTLWNEVRARWGRAQTAGPE
jgi:serine/threonine-protein kinase